MEKIEVTSFFGALRGVSLNGERVTANNIHSFDLNLRYSDKNVEYYTWGKNRQKIFISYDKNTCRSGLVRGFI